MELFDSFLSIETEDKNEMTDKNLSGKYDKSEISSFFGPDQKEEERSALKIQRDFLGLAVSDKKIFLLLKLTLSILLIFAARSFYLQILSGYSFKEIADENRVRIKVLKPKRGVIYDRNNKLLVQNIPNFTLSVIPIDLPKDQGERNEILEKISQSTGMDKKEIEEKLDKYKNRFFYESIILKDDIPPKEAIKIEVGSSFLKGVFTDVTSKRQYLGSAGLSAILGYIGKIDEEELAANKEYQIDDYLGKNGIELYYENILRGISGYKRVEVDVLGREKSILAKKDYTSGKDLVLSIDNDLTEKTMMELEKGLKKAGSKRGAAVVLNPQNGEILALISLPTFDNNIFSGGVKQEAYSQLINNPDKPLFARATIGEYPSGSTFKMIVGAAALQEGNVTANTTINSVGGIKINEWFFPDWQAGGHGLTNLAKALAWSVNTYFYTIGGGYENIKGLGLDRMRYYAELFGLNQKTGIDMPQERAGLFPTEEWKEKTKGEQWYIGDTYHIAIGQGDILVTPLQVANYTAVFANRGKLIKPRLIKQTIAGEKIEDMPTEIIRQDFIDLKNIDAVRQGLKDAVTYGSARNLADLPVAVAGKTGTAEVGGNKKPHAWFTGFAPYDDAEIVVTVLIENGGEGSTFAVPVAKEIMRYYFNKKSTKD